MKVRLFGDSIRVRLTQTEVASLAGGGEVEMVVPLGGQALACTVRLDHGEFAAHHAEGRITVSVPRAACASWAASDEEGINGTHGALRISVEKDYRCLHREGTPEDEGTYPNPAAKGGKQ